MASRLANGALGFLGGLLLWWALGAPYTSALGEMAEPLIRLAERPPVTRLVAEGTELTINRSDFDRRSGRPGLAVADLTANIILLTTLFAASRHPLRDRNIKRFCLAAISMVPVHIAAVVANVESIYALRLGPWSAAHYGVVARNFWGAAAHFYTIVGAFGAAFVLWWLFLPSAEGEAVNATRVPARGAARKRATRR